MRNSDQALGSQDRLGRLSRSLKLSIFLILESILTAKLVVIDPINSPPGPMARGITLVHPPLIDVVPPMAKPYENPLTVGSE